MTAPGSLSFRLGAMVGTFISKVKGAAEKKAEISEGESSDKGMGADPGSIAPAASLGFSFSLPSTGGTGGLTFAVKGIGRRMISSESEGEGIRLTAEEVQALEAGGDAKEILQRSRQRKKASPALRATRREKREKSHAAPPPPPPPPPLSTSEGGALRATLTLSARVSITAPETGEEGRQAMLQRLRGFDKTGLRKVSKTRERKKSTSTGNGVAEILVQKFRSVSTYSGSSSDEADGCDSDEWSS